MNKHIILENQLEVQNTLEVILKYLKNKDLAFLELIRNHKYEFKTGLSPRMINYYDEIGFLKGKRDSEKGKRKLSFSDILLFKLNVNLSSILSIAFINELNKAILHNKEDYHNINEFELAILITSTLLGIKDFYLNYTSPIKQKIGETKNLELRTNNYNEQLNISDTIRELVFSGINGSESIKVNSKTSEFLLPFINEIDKIRKELGYPLIIKDVYLNYINTHSNFKIDTEKVSNFFRKSFDWYLKEYDTFYQNEDGELFGVNIKHLGNNMYIPADKQRLITYSTDDLLRTIEHEIKSVEKTKAKIREVTLNLLV